MADTIQDETDHRRRTLMVCGLLVAAPILFHCIVFEAGVGGADGWSYFGNLESLVLDGDLDLTNNRRQFPKAYVAQPYMWCEETGRWVTHEPVGPAVIDAPFYMLGRLATRFWCPSVSISRLPYSVLDSRTIALVLCVSLAHNLYAIGAMLLVFLTLTELGARPVTAAGTALLTFFGGPLHYYACNGMSHAPGVLAIAGVLYLAGRVVRCQEMRAHPRWELFGLGALIGLASIMRYVSGLLAAPIGLCVFLFSFVDERRKRQTSIERSWWQWFGAAFTDQVVIALGCWSVAWITVAYWCAQFGHFFHSPVVGKHAFVVTLWPPPFAKTLLSPRHGFLAFCPVFVLALAGSGQLLVSYRREARERVRLAIISLASFAVIALVYDAYDEWAADGTYSSRFLTECVVFMSLGLWYFMEHARWLRPVWIRWTVGWGLAAFAYALFLLTRARLIYQVDGNPFDVGRSLSAYAYVFKEDVPFPEIVGRIWSSSFTLGYLSQRPMLLALFCLFWLLLIAAIVVPWPRKPSVS